MARDIYVHGSFNPWNGFIVPPRVSIRVYGVPVYSIIGKCVSVDGLNYIEYKPK